MMTTDNDGAPVQVGWALDVAGDEPRIRDTDLGESLGYERPRKLRELVVRLAESGDLPGIHSRPTVGRQSTGNGGERVYEVTEYWLTEAEALFVAARSETKPAAALLKEMIRVFMLARRGMLAPNAADLTARVERLEAKLLDVHREPLQKASSPEERLARARAKALQLVAERTINSRGDLVFYVRHHAAVRIDEARAAMVELFATGAIVALPPRGDGRRLIVTAEQASERCAPPVAPALTAPASRPVARPVHEDPIVIAGRFIEDRVDLVVGAWTPQAEVRAAVRAWALAAGVDVPSGHAVGAALRARGVFSKGRKVTETVIRCWIGVSLRSLTERP